MHKVYKLYINYIFCGCRFLMKKIFFVIIIYKPALKYLIEYYKCRGTTKYVTFLNASKTFW